MTAFCIVSSLGAGRSATLSALRNGVSGLAPCRFETVDLPTYVGEVQGLDDLHLDHGLARFDCRNNRLARLALAQDGFEAAVDAAKARYGAGRIGVFLGTSTSGILQTEQAYRRRQSPSGQLPPEFNYSGTQSTFSVADFVMQLLGLGGPGFVVSSACASTTKVFATAARMIETGMCDAAIVGGADSLCLTTLYGFNALQLLAEGPCRPFDAMRGGLSIGEAAGFALLERPRSPNAEMLHVLGVGESSDAHHMSAPHPEGAGAALSMARALASADLRPGKSTTSICTARPPALAMLWRTARSCRCLAMPRRAARPRDIPGTRLAHPESSRRWSVLCRSWRDFCPAARIPKHATRRCVATTSRQRELRGSTAYCRTRSVSAAAMPASFSGALGVSGDAIRVGVIAIELRGPGLASWIESQAVLAGAEPYRAAPLVLEPPTQLSPAERRRAIPSVKLALALGAGAVERSGLDPAALPAVFASSGADGDTISAILSALATPGREVSPTRFHNSVHNAPSGYWSMAVQSREAVTSLSCYDASFGAGLLEASVQAVSARRPILLIAYDLPYPEPLNSARRIATSFGVAFVLTPAPSRRAFAELDLRVVADPEGPATRCTDPGLEDLRCSNPAARSLPLLAILGARSSGRVRLDLTHGALEMGILPC